MGLPCEQLHAYIVLLSMSHFVDTVKTYRHHSALRIVWFSTEYSI